MITNAHTGTNLEAHSKHAGPLFAKLSAFEPQTLACMHGSAWHGEGGALLREFARAVGA